MDAMRFWGRVAPERIALVERGRDVRLSYRAMDAAADGWAAVLHAAGVRAGDRVAVLAGNRHEVVSLLFGCTRLGAALVPLNWRLAAAELAPVMDDAGPLLLVGEERFRLVGERLLARTGQEGVRWLDLDRDLPARLAASAGDPAPARALDAEAPALVLYTSGTTGAPKGALLPNRQLLHNAVATTTAWGLGMEDVLPVSTPLFHTGGWNVFATPIWLRGGRVVLFERFEPGDFLDGLEAEGCTLGFGVPTQLLMLLDHPGWRRMPALRGWLSGGAPCPPSVGARIREAGYRFREGYGLTECGPNCFAITDEEAERRPGVVGWPVPFLEMRLVDPVGRDVPEGEPGELLLRGPQLFAGYLNAPARTAEVMAPGGWLRTGDLAVRERDGAHRVAGRRKEMYISGGENVFPGEVEAALADCPGVAEVVVVGVPDARWGEVGRAFVQPRPGSSVREAEIVAHARSRLAGFKVPKSVVLLPELPRLGSGKPDRAGLARWDAGAP
jgi:fatty-acyl-CoA synthase